MSGGKLDRAKELARSGAETTRRWLLSVWDSLNPSVPDIDSYRQLALQLHYRLGAGAARSVLLVTPTSSPLCARGSALLARCAADELRRPILLVDASPRERQASAILDGSLSKGFADLLQDPTLSLEALALRTSHPGVAFLPSGAYAPSVEEAPDGRLQPLLEAAARRYDLTLLCGGAVLDDPMALALAPSVGCVLLLAIENETRIQELDAARDALALRKPRQMGLVLTTPLAPSRWSL